MTQVCKVQECYNPLKTKGYCDKHYKQTLRHGKLIKRPNTYSIEGDVCRIHLTNEKIILIDASDFDSVREHQWNTVRAKRTLYAYTRIDGKLILLHRFLLNPNGIIDHVNGNGLDNRKSNLRQCSYCQNAYNRRKRNGTTSIYKGVTYHKASNKWVATIKCELKYYYLGIYTDEYEAACVYNVAASLFFGEFASINKL